MEFYSAILKIKNLKIQKICANKFEKMKSFVNCFFFSFFQSFFSKNCFPIDLFYYDSNMPNFFFFVHVFLSQHAEKKLRQLV